MEIFTFIMEYAGGTYISQIKADSPTEALRLWGTTLEIKEIKGIGPKNKQKLINIVYGEANELVLIKGLLNVWCFTTLINGRLALVNIIKTSEK